MAISEVSTLKKNRLNMIRFRHIVPDDSGSTLRQLSSDILARVHILIQSCKRIFSKFLRIIMRFPLLILSLLLSFPLLSVRCCQCFRWADRGFFPFDSTNVVHHILRVYLPRPWIPPSSPVLHPMLHSP